MGVSPSESYGVGEMEKEVKIQIFSWFEAIPKQFWWIRTIEQPSPSVAWDQAQVI